MIGFISFILDRQLAFHLKKSLLLQLQVGKKLPVIILVSKKCPFVFIYLSVHYSFVNEYTYIHTLHMCTHTRVCVTFNSII